ncbi:helix-turn-helix transcriptional regulator [Desulfofustis limnaeus]|jgi:excisionase family DNA binding protein|uniref:DNA-binding protein n=1 Tax=Desulfofustis limnaeus TaxID=2740163 RepID=A0ABN6M9C9_9BACT|nr:helix-turn-helix transcriptional regulator [Desulfofustis limnaeus]MDX9894135.1 helix-turn-helix transcriptional regulator [Desulfofustis sp.]BDD89441.1 DNA-binding protein [Desulfofustis limnaeus]
MGVTKYYLTTKEVAQLLKVNEKAVYSLISEKGLPATKMTGKWLFPRHLVEEWLDVSVVNQPVVDTAAPGMADSGRLLIAGSDDLLFQRLLGLYHARYPDSIAYFANLGSMGGLRALRRKQCHIAVCHLLQDDNEEYNFRFAEREMERLPVFVNFSKRQQGLLVAPGNPKQISSVKDLAQPGITIVNRSLNTGTRLLLDYELTRCDINPDTIDGYRVEVARHLDAGLAVLSGKADAAPAIRPVAELLGLDFLPLRWERFDLLIVRDRFFDPVVQRFVNLLHEPVFKEVAKEYDGYDLSLTGKMVYPDNARL